MDPSAGSKLVIDTKMSSLSRPGSSMLWPFALLQSGIAVLVDVNRASGSVPGNLHANPGTLDTGSLARLR